MAHIENYFLFVTMCTLLILSPGPDTAIATKNTLTIGKSGGFQTMLGTCSALLVHTLAAIAGLSTIIVKSAFLFTLIKYAGAVYLIYLGLKAIGSIGKNKGEIEMPSNKYEGKSCFKQGFLTNILNPKVAVFFLTFLPQFVEPGNAVLLPFLIMGITYAILTAAWFSFYIILLNRIHFFMQKPITQKILEGMTGTVLIGFGLKLAFAKGQ